MQNKKGILVLLVISILLIPFVLAIEQDNILSFYKEYYGWIDFALYLLIFVGITQELMALKFKKGAFGHEDLGSGAKAVSIGLGVALALSLVTWEVKSGFYLFQLGPFIIPILIILALSWFIGWLRSSDKFKGGLGLLRKALFVFVVAGIVAYFFFPSFVYNVVPWSWATKLFNILVIIAIVLLLYTLGKHREKVASAGKGLLGRAWDALKGGVQDSTDISRNFWRDYKEEQRRKALEKERKRREELETKARATELADLEKRRKWEEGERKRKRDEEIEERERIKREREEEKKRREEGEKMEEEKRERAIMRRGIEREKELRDIVETTLKRK